MLGSCSLSEDRGVFSGQFWGTLRPGVRNKRMGDMKESKVLAGEVKRVLLRVWRCWAFQ